MYSLLANLHTIVAAGRPGTLGPPATPDPPRAKSTLAKPASI